MNTMSDKISSYLDETTASARMANVSQEVANKKSKVRKKNILYLIQQFLNNEGYYETAKCFQDEANLSTAYCVCDNIDLVTIVQEFESYYFMKYQKHPSLCRTQSMQQNKTNDTQKACRISRGKSAKTSTKDENQGINKILGTVDNSDIQPIFERAYAFQEYFPAHINSSPEIQNLAKMINNEIVTTNLNVRWCDIVGLNKVKEILKESLVYPAKYPTLFQGLLTPWRTVLLFGPPGTGKTMLAKAVATECNQTFFNITSSSIVSKWRGDSEKLVRVLFDLAHHYQPSCIFIDEFDSIMSHSRCEEHECARRLRAEILVHLDGLHSSSKNNIFLLATTNAPWDLESPVLRRFDKRILVELPNYEDRQQLITKLLSPISSAQAGEIKLAQSLDYNHIAKISEDYTGSDLKAACKEAAMEALRCTLRLLENNKNGASSSQLKKYTTITTQCVEDALKRSAPTTRGLISKYHAWAKEFGST